MIQDEGIKEDTLNLDSSVLTRYGEQEGAKKGYNPKKPGRPSHHPLLAFLGSGYVVNAWNRSGDTYTAQRAKEFFIQSRLSLGESFRVKTVLCDSGFYQIEFIEHLEKEAYPYIIAVRIHEILQREIEHVKRWKEISEGIEVGEFEFEHYDSKWTKPRRYVVVRQKRELRPKATGKQLSLFDDMEEINSYRYALFITNEKSDPETIWRSYRPRSNDENVIKDLKEGYQFGSFNMKSFWATEAVMVVNAVLIHNLIHFLNRNILNKNKKKNHLKTLRSKYFILPAILGKAGRSDILRIGVKDRSLRGKIKYFLEQISKLPPLLNCNAVET